MRGCSSKRGQITAAQGSSEISAYPDPGSTRIGGSAWGQSKGFTAFACTARHRRAGSRLSPPPPMRWPTSSNSRIIAVGVARSGGARRGTAQPAVAHLSRSTQVCVESPALLLLAKTRRKLTTCDRFNSISQRNKRAQNCEKSSKERLSRYQTSVKLPIS